MIFAATTRPIFDDEGWHFKVKLDVEHLSPNNQPKEVAEIDMLTRTMEMKAITFVKIIKVFLIEKIIPEILEKWLRSEHIKNIIIKKDNVRGHVPSIGPDFLAAIS
ncbi:hypothetical protein ACS0TY_033295 [Phlomoides rotata]